MFHLRQALALEDLPATALEPIRDYPFEVFTDPARYENPTENLLGYCCTLLQRLDAFRFEVNCCGISETLSVSPHCTLLLGFVSKLLFHSKARFVRFVRNPKPPRRAYHGSVAAHG